MYVLCVRCISLVGFHSKDAESRCTSNTQDMDKLVQGDRKRDSLQITEYKWCTQHWKHIGITALAQSIKNTLTMDIGKQSRRLIFFSLCALVSFHCVPVWAFFSVFFFSCLWQGSSTVSPVCHNSVLSIMVHAYINENASMWKLDDSVNRVDLIERDRMIH